MKKCSGVCLSFGCLFRAKIGNEFPDERFGPPNLPAVALCVSNNLRVRVQRRRLHDLAGPTALASRLLRHVDRLLRHRVAPRPERTTLKASMMTAPVTNRALRCRDESVKRYTRILVSSSRCFVSSSGSAR